MNDEVLHRPGRVWVLFLSLVAAVLVPRCAGQGSITTSNPPGPFGVSIYDIDGTTPLAGPAFLAQFYAAAVGESLQPIGSPMPFSTEFPGRFKGGAATVPGTTPGGSAMVQLVAWRASDGATFALADHVGAHVGRSDIFEAFFLGHIDFPYGPPAGLFGLRSFSLAVVVPEPSVLELALAAATVLALARGRRWFGPR